MRGSTRTEGLGPFFGEERVGRTRRLSGLSSIEVGIEPESGEARETLHAATPVTSGVRCWLSRQLPLPEVAAGGLKKAGTWVVDEALIGWLEDRRASSAP